MVANRSLRFREVLPRPAVRRRVRSRQARECATSLLDLDRRKHRRRQRKPSGRMHDRHGTRRTGFQRGLVTANREPITHTSAAGAPRSGRRNLRPNPSRHVTFRAAKLLKDRAAESGCPGSLGQWTTLRRTVVEIAPYPGGTGAAPPGGGRVRQDSGGHPGWRRRGPLRPATARRGGTGCGASDLHRHAATPLLRRLSGRAPRLPSAANGRRCRDGSKTWPTWNPAGKRGRSLGPSSISATRHLRKRIRRRAEDLLRQPARKLGIADGTDAEVPSPPVIRCIRWWRSCLPELCSRYGQHERTLFSFLAGSDPVECGIVPRREGSVPARGCAALGQP